MKKNLKNIIIALVVVAAAGGAYVYFSGSSTPALNGSSLASSSGAIDTASASVISSQIDADTSFLSTLLGLNSIKIDPTLFTSASFSALEDNTVTIEGDGAVGRPNPFAPIEEPAVFVPVGDSVQTEQIITIPSVKKPAANKPTKK